MDAMPIATPRPTPLPATRNGSHQRIVTFEMIRFHLRDMAEVSISSQRCERFSWLKVLAPTSKADICHSAEEESVLLVRGGASFAGNENLNKNSLIVCTPEEAATLPEAVSQSAAIATTDRSFFEIAFAVQELFATVQLWDSDLLRMEQMDAPLTDLLQESAKVMEGFLTMTDIGLSLVFSAGNESMSPHDPRYAALIEQGAFTQEDRASIEDLMRRSQRKPRSRTITESTEHGLALYRVVMVRNEPSLLVSFFPSQGMSTSCARDLFEILFSHLEPICARTSPDIESVDPVQAALMKILQEDHVSELYLEEALRDTPLWNAQGYTVCVLQVSALEDPHHRARVMDNAQRMNEGRSVSFMLDDEIVVISYSDSARYWGELGIESFATVDEALFQSLHLRIGASLMINDLRKLGLGYRQALIALEHYDAILNESLKSGGTGWTLACPFTWALPYYLTSGQQLDQQLLDSALETSPAMQLHKEDEETGSEQVRVIWTYLCTGGNVTATAKALFMHRNTVNYHVRKYAERFGADFSIIQMRNATILDFQRMFALTRSS